MVDQLCICMRLIAVWRPRARTLGRVRPSVALFSTSPQVQSHTLRVECAPADDSMGSILRDL